MYNPEHFFAPNDLQRYSLGTKNKGLQYESEGSLTMYIQCDTPGEERESNWLPAPEGDFEMTICTYWPKAEVNDGAWTPPPVERAS